MSNQSIRILICSASLLGFGLLSQYAHAVDGCGPSDEELGISIKWLYGVTIGNGKVVAVGPDTILSRKDGVHWHETRFPKTHPVFTDVLWDGKQYIAVLRDSDIFSSQDAIAWTRHRGIFSDKIRIKINSITRGKSRYVAVGYAPGRGVILTSTDAQKWKIANLPTTPTTTPAFFDVIWNDNKFVIAAGLTSRDGVHWKYETEDGRLKVIQPFQAIASNQNHLVGVGLLGEVYVSPDGESWSENKLDITTPSRFLYGATWGGSQFVIVGSCGNIFTSPDGRKWTWRDSGTKAQLNDVVWTGSEYIAVGGGLVHGRTPKQSIGIILTSKDAIRWHRVLNNYLMGSISDGE